MERITSSGGYEHTTTARAAMRPRFPGGQTWRPRHQFNNRHKQDTFQFAIQTLLIRRPFSSLQHQTAGNACSDDQKLQFTTVVNITGPLTRNLHFWNTIPDVAQQMLKWVANGVPIPLKDDILCLQYAMSNHLMSTQKTVFAFQEIKDLPHSGTIEQRKQTPSCDSGLKVDPKKGSDHFQLITDLQRLNQCCVAPKFQYEDIKSVISQIKQEGHVVVVVLKKDFHYTPVTKQHRDYFVQTLSFGTDLQTAYSRVKTAARQPLIKDAFTPK